MFGAEKHSFTDGARAQAAALLASAIIEFDLDEGKFLGRYEFYYERIHSTHTSGSAAYVAAQQAYVEARLLNNVLKEGN